MCSTSCGKCNETEGGFLMLVVRRVLIAFVAALIPTTAAVVLVPNAHVVHPHPSHAVRPDGGRSSLTELIGVFTAHHEPPPIQPNIANEMAGLMAVEDIRKETELRAYLDALARAAAEARAEQERIDAENAARARAAQAPRPVSNPAPATAWPTSLLPCGPEYALPPCYVKMRESGGNYSAKNPTSSASGAWQFLDSTWAGYGGYARAMDAPPAVQDERARQVWANGAGCGAWSAC